MFEGLLGEIGLTSLPKGWTIESLDEVCNGVFDCPHSTPQLSNDGPSLVRTQDIRGGFFDTEQAAKVSQETFDDRIARAEPSFGDVLFSREGTYFGDAAEVPKNTQVCLGQRMVLIRPKQEVVSSTYLRIWINSSVFQKFLLRFRDGSVAERLNLSVIRKLPVLVPAMEHQATIEKNIVPFEEKIKLNRQTNQTLEQIAQAIFKSWFVDFEPVKAKIKAKKHWQALNQIIETSSPTCYAEEFETPDPYKISLQEAMTQAAMAAISGKTEEQLKDLDEATLQQLKTTADLFPDALVESELGEIPEGWDIESLSKHIDVKHGFAFKGEYFSDETTNNILLTPGNFKVGGGFKFEKLKYYEGPIPDEYVLNKNDLLITMTDLSKKADTLGYPALVPDIGGLLFLHNQRLGKVVKKKQELNKYFLYCLLRSHRYRGEIVGGVTGTTVKHTSPKNILSFEHPFHGNLEKIFDDFIHNFYSKIECNMNNSEVLSKLRDALLPKLLSGELESSAGQEALEESA